MSGLVFTQYCQVQIRVQVSDQGGKDHKVQLGHPAGYLSFIIKFLCKLTKSIRLVFEA